MTPKLEVSEWSEDASLEGAASKRQRDREAFAAVLSPILKRHPQKLAIIDDIENGNSSAAIFLRQLLDGLKIRPARGRPEDKIRNRQFFLFVEAHRVRSKQQPGAKRGRPKKGQSESTKNLQSMIGYDASLKRAAKTLTRLTKPLLMPNARNTTSFTTGY
ncbi:hypothetical protein [Rhizobium sp. PL01]|uniref:hypothetical protein n=1 Tax=Rhizobium sp. PL01 TaxID=3085631 RepID=UPI002980C4CF|nr:hypothetical protein [Rhizobium sp. PL01]MDW5315502.1 hypothetical protein [Rhizobium sp. PL01]